MEASCSKCGSTKIIPDARTYETTGAGALATCVSANPSAMIFKETVSGYFKARICGDCGLAELYVENADELYAAYAKSLQAAGV